MPTIEKPFLVIIVIHLDAKGFLGVPSSVRLRYVKKMTPQFGPEMPFPKCIFMSRQCKGKKHFLKGKEFFTFCIAFRHKAKKRVRHDITQLALRTLTFRGIQSFQSAQNGFLRKVNSLNDKKQNPEKNLLEISHFRNILGKSASRRLRRYFKFSHQLFLY